MKQETTTKTITYLKYSLSKEEQEILTKSSYILEQVFDTIAEYSPIDLNDQQKLINYLDDISPNGVVLNCYNICEIIDTIVQNSGISFIAKEE